MRTDHKIIVNHGNREWTLLEIADKVGVTYSSIYARYRRGTDLFAPRKIHKYSSDRIEIQIERKAKYCSNCFEYKNFSEFHRNVCSKDKLHTICKKCRNRRTYQKQLEAKINNGHLGIRECHSCGDLFTLKSNQKKY